METFRLTGSDTIIINGNLITDSADGDIGTVVIDGNIANTVVGKNGNMIIAKDENGVLGTITLRLLKGSADDRRLNAYYKTYELDSATFVLGTGSIVKRLGNGVGGVIYDNYIFGGLHFQKPPYDVTVNVNGSTDQAVTVYTMRAKIKRAI